MKQFQFKWNSYTFLYCQHFEVYLTNPCRIYEEDAKAHDFNHDGKTWQQLLCCV